MPQDSSKSLTAGTPQDGNVISPLAGVGLPQKLKVLRPSNLSRMTAPVVFGPTKPISGLLDSAILPRFLSLEQNGKVAAEYVWIGGSGSDLRSKTKTLNKLPSKVEDLPIWNYDGSSTGQAPGEALPISCRAGYCCMLAVPARPSRSIRSSMASRSAQRQARTANRAMLGLRSRRGST